MSFFMLSMFLGSVAIFALFSPGLTKTMRLLMMSMYDGMLLFGIGQTALSYVMEWDHSYAMGLCIWVTAAFYLMLYDIMYRKVKK